MYASRLYIKTKHVLLYKNYSTMQTSKRMIFRKMKHVLIILILMSTVNAQICVFKTIRKK